MWNRVPWGVFVGLVGCNQTPIPSSVCEGACPTASADLLDRCETSYAACSPVSEDDSDAEGVCREAVIAAIEATCDLTEDTDDTDDTTSTPVDADSDGVNAADDCDDNDASLLARANDADCDGVVSGSDCDDSDPSMPLDDVDCDGARTAQDCDDDDDTVGACPVGLEVVHTDATNDQTLDATCPDGKVLLGGGFSIGQSTPFFVGMMPSMDGTTWTVTSEVAGLVGAQAVCASEASLPGYEVKSQTFTIAANGVNAETNTVTCPAGKKLLGGGTIFPAATTGSQMSVAATPTTDPTSFVVRTYNPTFGDKSQEVRIICADVDFSVNVVSESTGPTKSSSASLSCPTDDSYVRLLSVGASWSGNLWTAKAEFNANGASVKASTGQPTLTALCWD